MRPGPSGARSPTACASASSGWPPRWTKPSTTGSPTFHADHWAKIASTNPLERLIAEVKRRTDLVAIFPDEAAIVRLVGALLLAHDDEWAVGRRSMSLERLAPFGHGDHLRLPAVAARSGSDPPETTTVAPFLHHSRGHDLGRGVGGPSSAERRRRKERVGASPRPGQSARVRDPRPVPARSAQMSDVLAQPRRVIGRPVVHASSALLAALALVACASEPEGWDLACSGPPGACFEMPDLGPTPGTVATEWPVDERNHVDGAFWIEPGPAYEIGATFYFDDLEDVLHR
jgi:hypothetical protein